MFGNKIIAMQINEGTLRDIMKKFSIYDCLWGSVSGRGDADWPHRSRYFGQNDWKIDALCESMGLSSWRDV